MSVRSRIPRRLVIGLFASASLAAVNPAVGQCILDWKPGLGVQGTDGNVYAATTWDPDGAGPLPERLVVGGNFKGAGDVISNNIAAWDGATWTQFGGGIGATTHFVSALTVYNGELIAGGEFFTSTPGGTANNITRWDGASWQRLGNGMNFDVNALTVYNNELIAGGIFSIASGGSFDRIARWNGLIWQSLGSGMNNVVIALTLYNGDLIAAGGFTTAGGVSAMYIARWNGWAGSRWGAE